MYRSVLCVFAVTAVVSARVSKVVETSSGSVRGYKHETGVYQFLDIPYATAPTGVHKFEPALPAPTWQDTRDAVDTGIICPQTTIPKMELNKTMDENCLFTSVYVPDTSQKKLPVVVYVHGGGFQIGYGNWLQPYDLVKEHNILAVTFNYRLGVHGFLCLGTESIPGNIGMKDQVNLLRWVQKNIASFGGNPDDVTIAGYSAGSAAVDLLMLSKSTEGLFNRVIPESGANMAAFAVQSDPLDSAKAFAKSLGFENVEDGDALEQFYKTISYEQLTSKPFHDNLDATFGPSPCVERPSKDVFLDESPAQILKSGRFKKVPLLYGFANMEGLIRIGWFDSWKNKMNEKFSDFLPADLKFKNNEEREKVAKKVKEFYFGDNPVDNNNVLKYIDYFTDVLFAYPTLRSVKLQVENGHDQIYLYDFTYVDEQSTEIPYTKLRGANHCVQTFAMFGGKVPIGIDIKPTEEYKKISSTVRKIWANFIKTGQPVVEGSALPQWPAVSSNWSPHMALGNQLQLKGSLLLERTLFWEDIYSKYYREPIPPKAKIDKRYEL